jgi:flagellin-specific chaperone FliS
LAELAQQAKQYYDQAQESLSAGDWAGYGNNLNKLKDILDQLQASVIED